MKKAIKPESTFEILSVGTTQFRQLLDQVRMIPIPQGGLFLDRSDLYMIEGQYNFGNALKIVDLIVGGNWKQYVLNSKGTLFADSSGPIKINELGAYAQISRSFFVASFERAHCFGFVFGEYCLLQQCRVAKLYTFQRVRCVGVELVECS